LLEELAVVVLDRPTPEMTALLRKDGILAAYEDGSDLCGLHSGVGLPDRSLEDPAGWGADLGVPEHIHLFREGIVQLALENLGDGASTDAAHADEEIYEEIRITLLHEIGHHFGLDEDDLDQLGYA
jgi:predicted Zn-dependent protease with MMP-like domain